MMNVNTIYPVFRRKWLQPCSRNLHRYALLSAQMTIFREHWTLWLAHIPIMAHILRGCADHQGTLPCGWHDVHFSCWHIELDGGLRVFFNTGTSCVQYRSPKTNHDRDLKTTIKIPIVISSVQKGENYYSLLVLKYCTMSPKNPGTFFRKLALLWSSANQCSYISAEAEHKKPEELWTSSCKGTSAIAFIGHWYDFNVFPSKNCIVTFAIFCTCPTSSHH